MATPSLKRVPAASTVTWNSRPAEAGAVVSGSSSSTCFLAADERRPARFTLRPMTVVCTVSSSAMKRAV